MTRIITGEPLSARLAALAAEVADLESARPATPPLLARAGQGYILRDGDRLVALNDSRGLAYISLLVASPNRHIRCSELIDAVCPGARAAAAVGQTYEAGIDAEAARNYRRERERLLAARTPSNAAETDGQIAWLNKQLGAAGRRADSGDGERQRKAVRESIKGAMTAIYEHAPAVHKYLTHTIQTGGACCYRT